MAFNRINIGYNNKTSLDIFKMAPNKIHILELSHQMKTHQWN